MKKKATAALAATVALVAFGGMVDTASAAKPCVTRGEYSRIAHGMTIARVATVTGTKGLRTVWYTDGDQTVWQQRSYRGCASDWYTVNVTFTSNHMKSKTWN